MTPVGNAGPDTAWPEPLLASVRDLPAHSHLYIALSGGLDSVLLLYAAAHLSHGRLKPTAIHINHQLQPNAEKTEKFCERLCESLDIACRIIRVEVSETASGDGSGSGGLEEAARKARYRAFRSCLENNDLLLMAHHGDDQAETVLFRLLRGTGVAGLGGMPVSRPLGKGRLYRPFLDFSRYELESWACCQQIDWIEDPSNRDQRFDRNFLRCSIIPALKKRWPSLNRRLASTASACRESDELARSLADIHLSRCGTGDGGLDLLSLTGLTHAEQKNLVRWWVEQRGCSAPRPADWSEVLSGFMNSAADRQPEYRGDGYVIRRHQNTLYIDAGQSGPGENGQRLLPGKEIVWGGWRICLQPTMRDSLSCPELRVFARQGGERIRPHHNRPSKLLKKWLQEQAVPAWERNRLPLIIDRGANDMEPVAVGDLWMSEQYSGEAPASGWRLILERDSN